jgi:hypothetical protein
MREATLQTHMNKDLSLELVQGLVPKHYKNSVTQELIDDLNRLSRDPDYGEEFKQSMLTSTSILGGANSKWSLAMYVDAVKYFSLTAAQMSQADAYIAVFPERFQSRLDRGETKEDIRGEASRYNNSELVNKIRQQALVPLHLVNQGNVQIAINVLVDIATRGRSEMARVSAANGLLKELRAPESSKIEKDVGINKGNIIDDYEKAMLKMVAEQKRLIEAGGDLKSIANASIKVSDAIEVEIDGD